jgi:hypothetical protein
MSDQLVVEAATCTTHNKQKKRISTPSSGFEPAIPTIEQTQTQVLDREATGIDNKSSITWYYNVTSKLDNSTTPGLSKLQSSCSCVLADYLQVHRLLSVMVFGFLYSGLLIYVLYIH